VAVLEGNCWFDKFQWIGSLLYTIRSITCQVKQTSISILTRSLIIVCVSTLQYKSDHALFAPLREVINKVDRMVDIFNGTVENKKVEQNSCGNLNSPSHPLLQEVHDITEWKVESGIDRFIPWQLYEDPLLYHELWYGRSGTHIPQD
jgi:hypothetical protein